MRKLKFLALSAAAVFAASCEQETANSPQEELSQDSFTLSLDQCGAMGVLEEQIAADPSLADRMEAIEAFTKAAIQSGETAKLVNGQIVIPVVFHVIYRTQSENIPNSQLQEQVDALNEDFNLANPGRNTIPAEFQGVEANVGIRFELGQVIRVYSNKRSWRPDDSMKFVSPTVDPEHNLNIWVVNNMPYRGGNILGYAQFPGGSRDTDGVVLDYRFTGNTQYSTGRTATHEVGHWLNLRHIWGDGGCSVDDFVADTPVSDGPSRGCPVYPTVSCGTNDMTMNFMDYSDDPCLNMFTDGQTDRMMAQFVPGAYRAALAQ